MKRTKYEVVVINDEEEPTNEEEIITEDNAEPDNQKQIVRTEKRSFMRKYSSFKEYYDNDPEFRARHIRYMCQRITCDCGTSLIRSGLSRHKKSNKHLRLMAKMKTEKERKFELKMKWLKDFLNNDD